MRYKTPELEEQYKRLHPRLLSVTQELEDFCRKQAYPEPMATHIDRTRDQQEDIYWRIILAQGKGALTEAQARYQARNRFTWHFVRCAIDLRDYIYTPAQLAVLLPFLKTITTGKGKDYEFLYHDVGRGNHLHIGFRDNQWAKTITVPER